MRIKLNFEADLIDDKHKLCVIVVDVERYNTIMKLINFIKEKFIIEGSIGLYLGEYYIGSEYKVKDIIKEDEVILYIVLQI